MTTSQDKLEAEIAKLEAETRAFLSEAEYNTLQADRLARVRAEEDASAESQRIYDFIQEVGDQSVHRCITALSAWRKQSKDPITIRFNSPGGDLIAGMALYDYIVSLTNEGIHVTTVATGMCASMAAVLLQAGTDRRITPNAWFMVHEVSSYADGKLTEIEDETKWLIRAQGRLLDILASRANLSKAEIKRKWRPSNGWWMTPEETVSAGFADALLTQPVAKEEE